MRPTPEATRARVQALGELVARELGDPGALLVLRHSIREPIRSPDLSDAMAAPLTDEGRSLAALLAGSLPVARPVVLRHSPVPRCEETARILARGLAARGARVELAGPLEALGAVYVRDPDRVVERFAVLGQRGFARAWGAGELAGTAIDPPRVAGAHLLCELLALRGAEGSLDLHITHDLTLIGLLSLVTAIDAEALPWPAYLDGILLLPRGSVLSWCYGAARYETPLA